MQELLFTIKGQCTHTPELSTQKAKAGGSEFWANQKYSETLTQKQKWGVCVSLCTLGRWFSGSKYVLLL